MTRTPLEEWIPDKPALNVRYAGKHYLGGVDHVHIGHEVRQQLQVLELEPMFHQLLIIHKLHHVKGHHVVKQCHGVDDLDALLVAPELVHHVGKLRDSVIGVDTSPA